MKDVQEGGSFTPLPEGTYQFEIFEVEEKTSSKGDPMALIKLHPVSGPYIEKEIRDYLTFPLPGSAAAGILGRSKKFLHAIGQPFDGEDLAVDPSQWKYKKVHAKVKHETFISNKSGKELIGAKVDYYLLPEEVTAWDEEGPEL